MELTESCCPLRPSQTLTHQRRSYSKLTVSLMRFSMAASAEAGRPASRERSSGDSPHWLTFDHLQFVVFMVGVYSTVHSDAVLRCGHQAVVRPLNVAVEKQADKELKTRSFSPNYTLCFLSTSSSDAVASPGRFSLLCKKIVDCQQVIKAAAAVKHSTVVLSETCWDWRDHDQ